MVDTKIRMAQKARAQKRYKKTAKGNLTQKRYYSSDSKKEANNRWRRKNPEKNRAHQKVYRAVKVGSLKKGICVFCGNKNAFAHHNNYSKPLDVVWMCNLHHSIFHRVIDGRPV